MDAFESVVAMLLERQGYWVRSGFKVGLSKPEKRKIGRPSNPRWEIDLLAYKGGTNEVLAIECKSFLDSTGVTFRNGAFEPEERYKLFTQKKVRQVVLRRLRRQILTKKCGAAPCAPSPRINLCLAAGHIARKTDRKALDEYFRKNGWKIFDRDWICKGLREAADQGYENDVAVMVAKFYAQTGKGPASASSPTVGENA